LVKVVVGLVVIGVVVVLAPRVVMAPLSLIIIVLTLKKKDL